MPPKASTKLARALRDDVKAISAGRPMWWVSVHELALRYADQKPEAVDAAIALAIGKGWLAARPGPMPPLSVCFKHKGGFGS